MFVREPEAVVAVPGKFLIGKGEIGPGCLQQALLHLRILGKYPGGVGFIAGLQVIVKSVVLHPDGMDVVKSAHLSVLPDQQAYAAGPVAVPKAGPESEIQAPAGLFPEALRQVGIYLPEVFRCLQQGVGNVSCLQRLLRQVSCIMPAAAEGDGLIPMMGKKVLVAFSVHSRDRKAATLAKNEAERLPRGTVPVAVPDGERM